ncbi:NAD-dependent histone deacetylase HST3 [Colletotrichum tanaceti]|uniref:NAD-dependent histone deacetylase HST3 n=1 Tax=Colletotrichum tanaceti TaxID=1306861 RepID=A0A4U6XD68_9PEZI|nr:NAD-dependent histone deacetylase HST3 [Colletotrichum tanaceti]TKW51777.1 NAD-dependent histone deacetylase HST3 [Colletotrichum tanaceti]
MPTTQVTPAEDALLQGIADSLFKARKVVVITGAGISTNSGIPDFRSENGLYSLIQAQFDNATREDALESRCATSFDASPDEREPPTKRRRLSFKDSGICLSDDSQATEDQEVLSSSEEDRSRLFNGSDTSAPNLTATRAKGPVTRARSHELTVDNGATTSEGSGTRKGHGTRCNEALAGSARSSRRAASLPPGESPQRCSHTAVYSTSTGTQTIPLQEEESPARRVLRIRGRSASPGTKPRDNTYQARSSVLRRRSLLTHPLVNGPEPESKGKPPSLVPFASEQACLKVPLQLEEVDRVLNPAAPVTASTLQTSAYTTPKTTRFFVGSSPLSSPPSMFLQTPPTSKTSTFAQSNRQQPVPGFSSSPLSSPPPILFDPFEEATSSSSTRQTSSVASSLASSETDETPPSSQPSKSTLPNIKGRDLFDASIWADPLRTSVFYTFATTLRQKVKCVEPTESHHFIGHLRNRGKLVRCYTQNIDQIEEKVGLSTSLQQGPGHRGRFSRKSVGAVLAISALANTSAGSELATAGPEAEEKRGNVETEGAGSVEGAETTDLTPFIKSQSQQRSDQKSNGVECVFLHGSLESLRCFLCGKICAWDEGGRAHETLSGRQPECPYCAGATAARQERGKRALGVGKLRPDIVLYGEEHPNAHLISPIITHDLGLSPDLLLILGTSLKVHGLKVLVREFAKSIHSRGGKVVFVNYTKPPESSWGDIIDYWVQWDCDAWVSNLKERIPLLWLPPGTKPSKKKKESSNKTKKQQNTAEQGSNPKSESSKSGKHACQLLQPEAAVRSEFSAEKSEPPVEKSKLPAEKPEPPVEKSEPPVEKSEPPVEKSEPLGEKSEPPGEKSEPPVEKPDPPVEKPDPPAEKSKPPVENFEPPAKKPEPPVEKFEPPAKKPEPPAENSGLPAAKPEAPTAKPKKSPNNVTPEAPIRTTLPQAIPSPEDAAEAPKVVDLGNEKPAMGSEEAPKVAAAKAVSPGHGRPVKQKGKGPNAPKTAGPKVTPRRPMAVRDDTTNAVYLVFKVMAELRRITDNKPMPLSSSPASLRTEKPKPRRKKKSTQAVPSHTSESNPQQHPVANLLLGSTTFTVEQEIPQLEARRDTGIVAEDVIMSGTAESSILAAVKVNPRTRKRKKIDGEEVFVPGMPRPTLPVKSVLCTTPQKAKRPPAKSKAALVSRVSPPKTLSDMQRASMESLTLAPLRTTVGSVSTPLKLQPLEPVPSPPTGPLSVMSPNSRARLGPRVGDPFFRSDSVVQKLVKASGWTQPRSLGFMPLMSSQLNKETDAITALQGLKEG